LFAGLFNRAIYESAASVNDALLPGALAKGVAFSVAAGCGSGTGAATAKCLRGLTAAQIEALAGTASANSAYIAGPMVDGTIIPQQPVQAWHNGQFNHMPMMNGRTFDEANFSLGITEYFSSPQAPPTAAQYIAFVNTTYTAPNATPPGLPYPAGTAAAVLAHYPLSAYASPQLAWDALVSDSADACTTRHINKILYSQVPLYGYSFDDRTAPSYFPKLPGFLFLAYHTSDIQYLFPLYHGGPAPPSIIHSLNNKQQDLSDQLVAAWTNVAWTGNPNGLGNYPWPRFNNSPIKATYLSENIPVLSTYTDPQFSALHQCDFWDTILPYTYGPNY
jgi:para-nitrobenzyl esterase